MPLLPFDVAPVVMAVGLPLAPPPPGWCTGACGGGSIVNGYSGCDYTAAAFCCGACGDGSGTPMVPPSLDGVLAPVAVTTSSMAIMRS